MNFTPHFRLLSVALATLGAFAAPGAIGAGAPAWQLLPEATVDSTGVFVCQLLADPSDADLATLRVADAPPFGQAITLTRAQVTAAIGTQAGINATNWSGAERIRIQRRARTLSETELKEQVTAALQREIVREKGELELRLMRPWSPVSVPDEAWTIKLLDLPTAGVTPNFIVRFELRCGAESVGNWQLAMQAKVWREVPVAQATLKRGELLTDSAIALERRDVLALREAPVPYPADNTTFELAENVPPGTALTTRSVRPRPLVFRGRLADATVVDNGVTISLKVEVLEDGVLGQTVRVRNPKSRREFKGKVQHEQSILVHL
jgi:flagellar basal body P-ring formation protein FlgA